MIDKGYDIVDLARIVRRFRNGEKVSRRMVAITFDDGWLDNYELAFPIIERFVVPVTIFLVAGRIGKEGYIGWREIREMKERGVEFGAHTVDHPRLTEIPVKQARKEIEDSKKMLEDGLGGKVALFCYPYGYFNKLTRDLVEEAGFEGACCNSPGRGWPDGDRFALKRVTMTYRMSGPFMMQLSLSGYYVFVKEVRSGDKPYIREDVSVGA
jgi:peptidoglycan/xylan/chitin deacetylase (PgdA/CDA1 family)